jgi:hypothetical protein
MPIRLVTPEGLVCHPPGSGIQFANGSTLRPDHNGHWYLADSQMHQLDRLLAQGWREWSPPAPQRTYRDNFERVAVEKPLGLNELLAACKTENVLVRVRNSRLEIRPLNGDLTPQLRAHLEVNRLALRDLLTRQELIQWQEV